MNYKELPNYLQHLIKPFDYVSLLNDKKGHDFVSIPLCDILAVEGINFFAKKNIMLKKTATIFKCEKNFDGPIHLDTLDKSMNNFAFNFVLSGKGVMQWVSDIKGTPYLSRSNGAKYVSYKNVKSFDIIDSWSGDNGIVRVNLPHRVVAYDADRYCLSIRNVYGTFPKTFEDALKCIYN